MCRGEKLGCRKDLICSFDFFLSSCFGLSLILRFSYSWFEFPFEELLFPLGRAHSLWLLSPLPTSLSEHYIGSYKPEHFHACTRKHHFEIVLKEVVIWGSVVIERELQVVTCFWHGHYLGKAELVVIGNTVVPSHHENAWKGEQRSRRHVLLPRECANL